jgi:MraZ protein
MLPGRKTKRLANRQSLKRLKKVWFLKKVEESGGKWGKNLYLCTRNFLYKKVHMRFIGNIEAKTDAKGRVFLPAVFRKVLQASGEESLILRKDAFARCLVLYPKSVWNEQIDALSQRLSKWRAADRMVMRSYVDGAIEQTLDGNGRLLLPKRYLEYAEIEQNLKFIGVDNTIEIWRKDEDEKPFMEPEEFGKMLEQLMGNDSE